MMVSSASAVGKARVVNGAPRRALSAQSKAASLWRQSSAEAAAAALEAKRWRRSPSWRGVRTGLICMEPLSF